MLRRVQDQKQVGKALNSIAYGQAMMAAVRDYAKVRQVPISSLVSPFRSPPVLKQLRVAPKSI